VSGGRDSGGFRQPRQADPARGGAGGPQRRGLLDGLFRAPVPGSTPMPRLRTSLARGFVTVASSPLIVGTLVGLVAVGWVAVIVAGNQGPFAVFVNALAIPPLGTVFDAGLSQSLFGPTLGLIAVFGFAALRALIIAALVGMLVDVLQVGHSTVWSAVRGLRAYRTALAVNIVGIGLITIVSFVAPLFGAGIGDLAGVAGFVAGVYLFAFAPVIALTEGRRMSDAMSRSIRAARMPGAGNLAFAALYTMPIVVLGQIPRPGNLIGVNPSIAAWAIVFAASLLHVALLGAFAFRYLSVAHTVADPPPRTRGRARR
jgi:hypothetical protein